MDFDLIEINVLSDNAEKEMLKEIVVALGRIASKYNKRTIARSEPDRISIVITEQIIRK